MANLVRKVVIGAVAVVATAVTISPATPAFADPGFVPARTDIVGFFTEAQWWTGTGKFGIAAVLTGTIEIALVALAIGVPVAVAAALYISEYAPAGLRRTLIGLVDMQQAQRVSHKCAFFLAEHDTPGRIVESGLTTQVFENPTDSRTADYVHGRFG